jgi:hypothetical protein
MPLIGGTIDAPACTTPGTVSAASRARSNSARRSAGSSLAEVSRVTSSTRSASNPGSSRVSVTNVRTKRPAATTSTSESATCATTSAALHERRLSVWLRACSASTSRGAIRVARTTGMMPKTSTVAEVTAAVKASTRQLSETSSQTTVSGVES